MPRSATGRTEGLRRQHGLSLIELLVVLVVVAVMAAAVAIAFPDLDGRRAEAAAERLHQLIGLACERALLGGRDIGIALAVDRIGFGTVGPDGFTVFAGPDVGVLRTRHVGDGLRLALSVDGRGVALPQALPGQPQLACLASGERTAFELLLTGGSEAPWRLRGGSGGLTLERVDAG